MKINELDLTKTISDFIFLGEKNPEEKAKIIFKLKHKLTAHGFEKYMQYYFLKFKKYDAKLNGKTYEFDGGVDILGQKKEGGLYKYLVVQCKKNSIKDITENDISSFFGKISQKYLKYKDILDLYFITTSKFTYKAEKFAKDVGIKTVNLKNLYDLQKIYSLEQFQKDLEKEEGKKEFYNSFNKNQISIDSKSEIITAIKTTNKDVFTLLKQIRRDYSHDNQMQLGEIAKNETLQLLASQRPHSLLSLKKAVSKLSTKEKNKMNKFGYLFVERLKYIDNGEKNEIKNRTGFFKLLSEFLRK